MLWLARPGGHTGQGSEPPIAARGGAQFDLKTVNPYNSRLFCGPIQAALGVPKMYAVIATGGKQYRVQEGAVVRIEKLDADQGHQRRIR